MTIFQCFNCGKHYEDMDECPESGFNAISVDLVLGTEKPTVKDVTEQVDFGNPDDECLPITKCVCGVTFPAWEFIINMDSDYPYKCPFCSKRFYFRNSIQVFMVTENG